VNVAGSLSWQYNKYKITKKYMAYTLSPIIGPTTPILNSPERQLTNNKLSYRRGTARHAVSVEPVQNVAHMFVELHLTSPATGRTGA